MPNKGKGKKKQRKKFQKQNPRSNVWCNFVLGSGGGCYIAHGAGSWVIEALPFDPEEWGEDIQHDLSLDPESMLLTAINSSHRFKSYFISFPYLAIGKNNQKLKMGETTTKEGEKISVTTLIVVLKPRQIMDLCFVHTNNQETEQIDLFSDIKELPEGWSFNEIDKSIKDKDIKIIGPYGFPIGGNIEVLCSQGNHGGLTHFFPQTCYAIDLECSVGSPVLAVGDGVVTEISQSNTVSGIHAKNLFTWNSMIVKLDDGNFVEYVHIMANSVTVSVGERVTEGQEICKTGNVGFCPVPHLHIQFHESDDPDAPTVPFTFKDKAGNGYCPVAGHYYQSS